MNDKEKIKILCELILQSAPLAWAANGDLNSAADWEKEAVKTIWVVDDELCNKCGTKMLNNYCSKCEKKNET